MNAAAGCAVVVFAKAPVAGYAKTRLAAVLGSDGAARLAAQLLIDATAQAIDAGIGPVEVCCAPDAVHPAFAALARRFPVTLVAQCEGDLGERMHDAFTRTLRMHGRALVIGSDVPGLDAHYLRDAAMQLHDHDAVFGPALDGGYTLVGLKAPAPRLFEDIAWSTASVMRQTRERVRELGLAHAELTPLADIDEPADLDHLTTAAAALIGRVRST